MKMLNVSLAVIALMRLIPAEAFFGMPELVHEVSPENVIQNTITASNSVKQLLNQAQQIQIELQNKQNLQGHENTWSNTQPLLQQLASNAEKGQALAYSMQGIDQQFHRVFPGYVASTNYQTDYQHWAESTQDTLRNTLGNAGIQANSFGNEQQQLHALAGLSNSAQGRMQALQISNRLATQQVGQMQKLRQLIINQTNAQNAYMAYEVQKEQAQQATLNAWITHSDIKFPRYRNHGFSVANFPAPHH